MRSLSFVLLFSTWISFAVSTVTVADNKASGENGSSLILRCSVTGNDTFKGWETPDGKIANNGSVFKTEQIGTENSLTILTLEPNDNGTWTCLSKDGDNSTVAVTVLTTSSKTTATVIKSQYIAPTSSIPVMPIKTAALTTVLNVLLTTVTPTKAAAPTPVLNVLPTVKPTKAAAPTTVQNVLPTVIPTKASAPTTVQNVLPAVIPTKASAPTTVQNVLPTVIPTKASAPTTVQNVLPTVIPTKASVELTPNIKITMRDGETLVSWPPFKEGNVSYYIVYRRVDSDQWMNTPILTENKYKFSQLDAGKEYKFQVYIVGNVRPYTNIETYNGKPVETEGSSKKKVVIAAVVISLVLLAVIILDIFCCCCNKCGFFYSCMKLTQSKRNYKANDAGSPQEGMDLNELNANQDDPGWV